MFSTLFSLSLQNDTAYRVNFIMGRLRNLLQLFIGFFLWTAVFETGQQYFGYTQGTIITYLFGVYIVKSLVNSYKTQEIAGEIARGDITNYLLKPLSYFRYWFIRDLSTKSLNFFFSIIEFLFLFILIKPNLLFQTDIALLGLFGFSLIASAILYFLLVSIFSVFSFWFPEQAWGSIFLLFIFTDFLGGVLYPLDIFPQSIQNIMYMTPFPYLFFVPVQMYLGKLTVFPSLKALGITGLWIVLAVLTLKFLWTRGLRVYRGEGR